MPNKQGHRRFGNVRRLPSGRYQARYPGPDGRLRSHPQTFDRKGDAERALSLIEAQMIAGEWTDPQSGKARLSDYARDWLRFQRHGEMRTAPEVYRTRADAERALWAMALEGRADCHYDRRYRALVLLATFASRGGAK